MKKMNRKGFTIVELVIVIAVIAILAGVLIPTFSGIVTKAQDSKALQETRNAMVDYISKQETGSITDGTEFYYFADGFPTVAGNDYKAYKFTYTGNKLVAANPNTVTVVVTVTDANKAYSIGGTAVTFVSTVDGNVKVKAN